MYLEKIIDHNIGTIGSLEIEFEFNENSNPKPIILVGENGTGKSTLLSNIVDAFYECAKVSFSNAMQSNENSGGTQYYKKLSPVEIKVGEKYLLSYLEFQDKSINPKKIIYIYKSGNLSTKEFRSKINSSLQTDIKWKDDSNYKKIIINKDNSEKIFSNNIICYFSPDRYEKPFWLGNKYYKMSDFEHPSIEQNYSGILNNDISVENMTLNNLAWLLDIIIDSRTAIKKNENEGYSTVQLINDINTLSIAKNNVEKIMSEILCEEITFGLNYRNNKGTRFNIRSAKDNTIIIPTIDSLSTGQSALFHIFATIIRYADNLDIYNSIYLDKIKGIVIIDEIELHLHSNLQYEILPKLIKLFPKVQFIITSHSPLFLLGMKNQFSEKGISVYDMPTGTQITTERFSEFHKSYEYLMNTQKHENEIKALIAQNQSKILVITEGSTDWKHLKAAYKNLSNKEKYQKIFKDLDFDFLEYEPENSSIACDNKLEMGNKKLVEICKNLELIKQTNKIIFITDCDDKPTNQKMSEINKLYKTWKNNVYSFILPIPEFRKDTPEISIEHLYAESIIKTSISIDNIDCRLFMGNEFNEYGISLDKKYIIKCHNQNNKIGPDNISILDRSNGTSIIELTDEKKKNHALSKMDFANKILNQESPFEEVNFENFIEIFRIIKEISNQPLK